MIRKTMILLLLVLFLAPVVNADLDMGNMTIDNQLQEGPETYTVNVTNRLGIKSLPITGAKVTLRKKQIMSDDKYAEYVSSRTGQTVTFNDVPKTSDPTKVYFLVGEKSGCRDARSKNFCLAGSDPVVSMTLVYYQKNVISTPKVPTPSR